MKQIRSRLNYFFISEEADVSRHDEVWFFGSIGLMMLIVMITMISKLVTGV